MSWFREQFGHEKVAIASLYMPSMKAIVAGKLGYDDAVNILQREIAALEEGGIDGIVLGNQQDLPWEKQLAPEYLTMMPMLIRDAMQPFKTPLGITVFWDTKAALAVAKSVGAGFVRGVFSGAYAGPLGLMEFNVSEILEYREKIKAGAIKAMFMVNPIVTSPMDKREIPSVVKDFVQFCGADAVTLCGPQVGEPVAMSDLQIAQVSAKGVPVILNNGANTDNIGDVLSVCDGAVVATSLKEEGSFSAEKVRQFMDEVRAIRGE